VLPILALFETAFIREQDVDTFNRLDHDYSSMDKLVAYLDNGSEITLISRKFALQHKLTLHSCPTVTMASIGDRQVSSNQMARIYLLPPDSRHKPVPILAAVTDFELNVNRQSTEPAAHFPSLHKHLHKVNNITCGQDLVYCPLLIGCDFFHQICLHNPIHPSEPEGEAFVLYRSRFGLIPNGVIRLSADNIYQCNAIQADSNGTDNCMSKEEEKMAKVSNRGKILPWYAFNHFRGEIDTPDDILLCQDIPGPIYSELEKNLQFYFHLESLGITDDPKNERTHSEEVFTMHLKKNLKRDPDGTYILPLIFDPDIPKQPCNYRAVRGHAVAVFKSLKESGKKQLYDDAVKELVNKGFATLRPDDGEKIAIGKGRRFIGLSPVYKGDRKVRLILNARSKFNGYSYNDLLLDPPSMTGDLFAVLMRARLHELVLAMDIRNFFPSIRIPEEQHHMLCCLIRNEDKTFSLLQFTHLPFGLSQAPILSMLVLRFHLLYVVSSPKNLEEALKYIEPTENFGGLYHAIKDKPHERKLNVIKEIVESYLKSIWIDDDIESFPDATQLALHHQVLSAALKSASMKIGKIVTNCDEARSYFETSDLILNEDGTPPTVHTLLGVTWNIPQDKLSVSCNWDHLSTLEQDTGSPELKLVTKRMVSSVAGLVYDPIGLACPVTLESKLLLKAAHDEHRLLLQNDPNLKRLSVKKQWNLPLSANLTLKFQDWIKESRKLQDISVDRWSKYEERHLVTFYLATDASALAMSACVHMKVFDSEVQEQKLTFMCGKTKTYDPSTLTIPRAELTAMQLGCKLLSSLLASLELESYEVIGVTDAKVALAWLRTAPAKLLTYCKNRVSYITSVIPASQWSYVPTDQNPADVATRKKSVDSLVTGKEGDLWFSPNVYLVEGALQPGIIEMNNEDSYQIELVTDYKQARKPEFADVVLATNAITRSMLRAQQSKNILKLDVVDMLLHKFSDLDKILQIISLWKRVKKRIQEKLQGISNSFPLLPSKEEKAQAMLVLVKHAQARHFKEEIRALKSGNFVKKSSALAQMDPFLDKDGLMRANTRIDDDINCAFDSKPPILPKKSEITYRYIREVHERSNHYGYTNTLYIARKHFWIVGAVHVVKQVISRCIICNKARGNTVEQSIGNLHPAVIPEGLGTDQPRVNCFQAIAIDTIGPYKYLNDVGQVSKIWILVIVCAQSRYIRLKLLDNLSASTLMVALETHFAETNRPTTIFSDSFSSMQQVSHFYRAIMAEVKETLRKEAGRRGIKMTNLQCLTQDVDPSYEFEHIFSAPYQKQMLAEGVIGSLKRSTSFMLNKSPPLPRDQLNLLLANALSFANNRPLLPSGAKGLSSGVNYISPALIVKGYASNPIPFVKDFHNDVDPTLQPLYKAFTDRIKALELFSKNFTANFILDKCRKSIWQRPKENLEPGSLVMLTPANTLKKGRDEWKTAIVESVNISKRDQKARTCMVRTSNGKKFLRPVRNVILLKSKQDLEGISDIWD